jgi:hypothetical protein
MLSVRIIVLSAIPAGSRKCKQRVDSVAGHHTES